MYVLAHVHGVAYRERCRGQEYADGVWCYVWDVMGGGLWVLYEAVF